MADKSQLWVGIDAGEEDVIFCVIDKSGKPLLEREVRGNADTIHEHLAPLKKRVAEIGVEASTSGIILARGLIDLGYNAVVYEARKARKFLEIRSNKTDLNDARGIADLARLGRKDVPNVHVKSAEMEHLGISLSTRQAIVRQRVAMENIIRSKLISHGGRLKASWSQTSLRRHVHVALDALKEKMGVELSDELLPLVDLCCAMRAYEENLEADFKRRAEQISVCRRFMGIKGVGPICALSYYAAICEPYRFTRNADVGPYLGMVPRVHESGKMSIRMGISRRGNAMTRTLLINAARWHLYKGASDLQDWGLQLSARAGSRRARVALARKLSIVMLAMWKSGQSFEARKGDHNLLLSS